MDKHKKVVNTKTMRITTNNKKSENDGTFVSKN